MNRSIVLDLAYQAVAEISGATPTVRTVAAMYRQIVGKGIRGEDVRIWISGHRDTLGIQDGHTPDTSVVLKNEDPGYSPSQIGIPSCASADLKGIIDSAQGEDRSSPPLLPSVVGTPQGEKVRKGSVASQNPDTDFGEFEPDVAAMVLVEQANHPRKKVQEAVIRQRLALLWRKHGDDAFARGLEVGVSSGHGVNYGRAVMERYDPNEQRHLRAVPDFENESDKLPTTLDLIEAGVISAEPSYKLDPWQIMPSRRFANGRPAE